MGGDTAEPERKDEKAERLAEKLRENLQRRKSAPGRDSKPKAIKNQEKL